MKTPLYRELAALFGAWKNCVESGNYEWEDRHLNRINKLIKDYLPSGSGFDSGTQFVPSVSRPERLVFSTSFHHMDEYGGYDRWTEHDVIVTPSLQLGFLLRITGRDYNNIKEYIADMFVADLHAEIDTEVEYAGT